MKPTAQAFAAEVAVRPRSCRALPPGAGKAARLHRLPFQCSTRAWPRKIWPTAHAFAADVAVTSSNCPPRTLGAATRLAYAPVSRRMSGRATLPLAPEKPTAKAPPGNFATR
ncbi:MAG: hypothetical protein ACRDRJ_52275 [Streptosporangiaceae bacterium]